MRYAPPAAYFGDRAVRTARPHKLLDPAAGPLIAVRLNVLTRKTLGGLETDLDSRVLAPGGEPVPGLYAAGEAAGFGGGGVHGYRALEGTFLGGCTSPGARPDGRRRRRQVSGRQKGRLETGSNRGRRRSLPANGVERRFEAERIARVTQPRQVYKIVGFSQIEEFLGKIYG